MDTKLKNIKHGKGMKIAALAVAILMFFLAGNFASLFIKGFANFKTFSNPEDFTQTASFRWQMNQYINEVIARGRSESFSFEDYLKSEEAKSVSDNYHNETEKISAAHDLLDKSGIEVYVDTQNRYRYALNYKGVRYFFSYDGSPISHETFNSYNFVVADKEVLTTAVHETEVDGTNKVTEVNAEVADEVYSYYDPYYDPYGGGGYPAYIGEITDALAWLNNVGEYTCYGESTKEEILQVIEDNKLKHLEEDYYWYYENAALYPSVASTVNVNYAIIYKNSDTVFTNCGVTLEDSQAQIREKLGSEWAECIVDGKYELLNGKEIKEGSGVYAMLHDMLFGGHGTKSVLNYSYVADDIQSAYFAISEGGVDAFSVIRTSFYDYIGGFSLTTLLVLMLACLIIGSAACIYLLSAAGKTADGIKLNFFDKIPAEINAVLGLAVMFAMAVACVGIVVYEFEPLMAAPYGSEAEFIYSLMASLAKGTSELIGLCVAVFFMIWTGLNASLIRNIRNKTFFRHSIVGWVFKPIGWLFKKLKNWVKKTVGKMKYIINCDYSKGQSTKFKVLASTAVIAFVLATAIYYFFAGVLMFSGDEFFGFLMWVIGILGDAAIVVFVIILITSQDRIMAAVSDMRKGELTRGIDKKYMPPFMSRFADDILFMQDGLQKAVDSAVKDQRMKAELITNVSHDLKTPLTSIVNYVDLLKKCEIEDETAQRYVSILDEKAQRMKKLIEDLVEASKASSGALEIHSVKLNLCEFATQAVGEHEDELKKYNIELVLKLPEEPVMVIADAQKTSRIAENLFSNIRKYALEGTRVYIDVAAGAEYGSIIFKNISKHPLDISPDELTQRFVRGDASRSGEGSGLGLSIAKDLCELQNGRLGLQIDGDLFKAIVALPIA